MARADDWRTYMALKASQRLTKASSTPVLTPGYISKWLQQPLTDWRFAELFDAAFPGQFKCVDATSKDFFRFTNHRWVANAGGDVSKLMSVHLHDALHEHARSLVDESVRKKAYRASLEFQCVTRKDKIKRALVGLTGDPTFVERLDSKVNLLGFDNGVYDLDAAQFWGVRPEDAITFSVGYEYTPNVEMSIRAEVLAFVHSIFGNAEVEEYVLLITASCLHGYRRFEEFYFHTGVGRNGKGALAELFAFVFGDYMGTMDTTFFTQPRKNSSGSQPELANKKGVRYLSAREAEDKEKIQVAKLNKITGGDPIETRGLFGKPFTYKPQFGIHFHFNALPKLSRSGQKASEERTRVVEYPNVFTSNPAPNTNQRLADPDIKQTKVSSLEWRQQTMLMLLELFHTKVKGQKSLKPPAAVKQAAEGYLDGCNPAKAWVDQNYRMEDIKNARVLVTDLYLAYKKSCDDAVDQHSFNAGVEAMGVVKRKISRLYWCGLRELSDDEKKARQDDAEQAAAEQDAALETISL
ncbi:hypothetical protein WJX72_001852 [[Myrmecia] bisecta]|uniref:SF3 helicase domain-containing protein n=1 Tax=[Myrmecia] bisecta TaxID=41462 RepID=A0AAW1Q8A2_9CHLO